MIDITIADERDRIVQYTPITQFGEGEHQQVVMAIALIQERIAEDQFIATSSRCSLLENYSKRCLMTLASSLSGKQSRKSPTLFDVLLQPARNWIDSIPVEDEKFARSICKLIPAKCPFERDIILFGQTLFHIPPMCKLNPFYEQFVGLRFRALCYLADECGEDVSIYCC